LKKLRAICFDLDDTLWDMAPVIPQAEQRLYDWYAENYPRVVERYSPRQIRNLRLAADKKWPELRHDLTELRLRILREIATSTGYDEQMASAAFDVFFAARNDVTLYEDVIPVLRQLGENFALYALSNGNADLRAIGIAAHFSGIYTAREMGVAKPNVRFFREAAQRCGLPPEEMLHVGDHPENDVVAARRSGMPAVWLNRTSADWTHSAERPDAMVSNLYELVAVLQA
jgi:2-haloalkanoic acid dehalogenase type II